MASNDLPPSVRNSRWWYLIAAVPAFYLLVIVFISLFVIPAITGGSWSPLSLNEPLIAQIAVILAIPSFLITLILPYALYRDIGLLNESEVPTEWEPDQHEYAIAGAAGIFVTGVSFGVSVYYLYQRHVHLGVP